MNRQELQKKCLAIRRNRELINRVAGTSSRILERHGSAISPELAFNLAVDHAIETEAEPEAVQGTSQRLLERNPFMSVDEATRLAREHAAACASHYPFVQGVSQRMIERHPEVSVTDAVSAAVVLMSLMVEAFEGPLLTLALNQETKP